MWGIRMKFTFKGIKIGGIIITTKRQLETMPMGLDDKDITTILKLLKEFDKATSEKSQIKKEEK
jgi:hypothetical protein